ncbi:MAG TPA: ABC transporter ATP-binding protein [Gammaproteobacteria bacterium]|nr:ABC transporter ATP-binding protein [Gammaproteobacteria bacterium]
MIQLHNVSKTYQRGSLPVPVLRDVSLRIEKGEFVAIMGPSGSGKSTLLNILGCLDTADSGHYHLNGKIIQAASEDDLAAIRNRMLGFVFQSFNLIPRIDAERNVELPMMYAGVRPAIRLKRAQAALKIVGLAERAKHVPAHLSGGQQQRVAIARAIVNDPQIIIADEPTGALDSRASKDIMRLFQQLQHSGKTIVMVTHEDEIAHYAQRVIRVRDGSIVDTAPSAGT